MRRDVRAYLADVLEASGLIGRFTATRDLEAYRSDAMMRSAVERQLGIIGEAHPGRRTHRGIRNVLAHGYDIVDDEVVWKAVTLDVPRLNATVAALLAELEA